MKNYKLFILAIVGFLSGCSAFGEKNSQAIITPREIYVDSKLVEPCVHLPQLQPPVDLDGLAVNYTTIITLYGECAVKQDASIVAIKTFANKKEQQ